MGFDKDVSAAQIRSIDAETINALVSYNRPEFVDAVHPVRDGYILPRNVGADFSTGQFNAVPTLFGYNTDEDTLFFPDDPQPTVWLENFLRPDQGASLAQQAEALRPVFGKTANTFKEAGTQWMGDEIFGMNVRYVTRQNDKAGQPDYLYIWSRSPVSAKQTIGAFHAAEIPFVFDTHESILARA